VETLREDPTAHALGDDLPATAELQVRIERGSLFRWKQRVWTGKGPRQKVLIAYVMGIIGPWKRIS
jgi:hypothetical protein